MKCTTYYIGEGVVWWFKEVSLGTKGCQFEFLTSQVWHLTPRPPPPMGDAHCFSARC